MIRLFLLWLTLLLGVLFLFYEPNGQVRFPFSDMSVNAQNYIYYLCEKLIVAILAYDIVTHTTEYRFLLKLFFAICIIDVLDYVLFYGDPWFGFPITWNIMKVCIFGVAILYEKYGR